MLALCAGFRLGGDRWPWLAVLFYAPRVVYALPGLLIAPALDRHWLWVPVAAVLVVAGPLMGLHLGRPRAASGPIVRLLSCNAWFGAGDLRVLADELAAARPDIAVLQASAGPVDALLRFDHVVRDDQFTVASRWPVQVTARGTWVSERYHRPWVRFAVQSPLGTLDVIAVHPHSPRELFNGKARLHEPLEFLRRQLTEIAEAARAGGPLLVLAGDFNVPDGGSLLPSLFSGLHDAFAEAGRGYGYTFPVNGRRIPWLRLDRVLYGSGLRAVSAAVDARRGADHAALIVELTAR